MRRYRLRNGARCDNVKKLWIIMSVRSSKLNFDGLSKLCRAAYEYSFEVGFRS